MKFGEYSNNDLFRKKRMNTKQNMPLTHFYLIDISFFFLCRSCARVWFSISATKKKKTNVDEICKQVDFCANNPCPEGHQCNDHGNDFSCECPEGRSGTDCSQFPRTVCSIHWITFYVCYFHFQFHLQNIYVELYVELNGVCYTIFN